MQNLEINNYKCLDNISIPNLKRVNLFTGKNNTGKSTILEAISLFSAKGDLSWIRQLLQRRGEINNYSDENANIDSNLEILSSFFSNRNVGFKKNDALNISFDNKSVSLRFIKYTEEGIIEKDSNGNEIQIGKKKIISDDDISDDISFGLEIKIDGNSQIINLEKSILRRRSTNSESINFQFVNAKGDDIISSATLWDKITLSEKEELVVDALKIIQPNINRLSFVGEDNFRNARYPIVKLSNTSNIYPLKAMGDGINRILNLTLALVNSDNGFLLIDEVENGLHHSVQEKLWKIIFDIAHKLNIQVFATTHSNDCITSFAQVLEENEEYDGCLYRLSKKEESVIASPFSKNEITEAAKQKINLR